MSSELWNTLTFHCTSKFHAVKRTRGTNNVILMYFRVNFKLSRKIWGTLIWHCLFQKPLWLFIPCVNQKRGKPNPDVLDRGFLPWFVATTFAQIKLLRPVVYWILQIGVKTVFYRTSVDNTNHSGGGGGDMFTGHFFIIRMEENTAPKMHHQVSWSWTFSYWSG